MRGVECVYSGGISVALAAALWQGLAVVAYHACPAMWLCMLLVEAQGLTATVFEALGMWPELCHSCDSCCLIPKTATGCGSLIRAIVLGCPCHRRHRLLGAMAMLFLHLLEFRL